ncbi:hypothetical protein NNM65_23870, partial [Escherichia coli]|nr:hypothetical protein [Escherichia coli]
IIDPRQSQQIQHRHLHDNADYSPWEGFTCQGAIVRTLSRGETADFTSVSDKARAIGGGVLEALMMLMHQGVKATKEVLEV